MSTYIVSSQRKNVVIMVLCAVAVAVAISIYAGTTSHQKASAEVSVEATQAPWGTLNIQNLNKLELDELHQQRHYNVDLKLTNTSDETIQFSPGLQAFIVDSLGQRYAATAQYLAPKTIIGGEIAGRGFWQGTLDFAVPENSVLVGVIIDKDAASVELEGKF